MKYKKITNIEELNQALDEKRHDFTLLIAGGLLHSRKRIKYNGKGKNEYHVTNHIDGTKQVLTAEQIFDDKLTNIGIGMQRGAFLCEINE